MRWSPSASNPLTPKPATAISSAAHCSKPVAESPSIDVIQFREKPDRPTAEAFLASGNFAWNAGIFVWRARDHSRRAESPPPEPGCWLSSRSSSLSALREQAETLARLFPSLERIPIDKAVMEQAARVRVLEVPYRWSDVGDWRALAALLKPDSSGNATQGSVVARDTTNSIIISDDGGLVATLGVDDLVVVHSGNATLVARKDQLDKLKALVEGLKEAGYGDFV